MRAWRAVVVVAVAFAAAARAGELPDARLVLEVFDAPRPGRVPEAAPVRFALFTDGRVFTGGTSELLAGQLDKREAGELDRRAELVRKQWNASTSVVFGPGETRYRLRLGQERQVEILASGDPEQAPAALQPLARFVVELAEFDHASLRPWRPATCLVAAVEQTLPGGCRAWTLPFAPGELASPRVVPIEQLSGWPLGALAASACARDGRHYAVTFRPLLPGER